MSILKRIWSLLSRDLKSDRKTYELSESLYVTLKTLADDEGRTPQDLLPDVVAAGIVRYRPVEKLWQQWESLSPREQDIAALTCLGYTNRQISARLALSPETIKTHVRNVLLKFGVKNKAELRHILAGWDFNSWM